MKRLQLLLLLSCIGLLQPTQAQTTTLTLHGTDSYGDGWDCNGYVEVLQDNVTVETFRVTSSELSTVVTLQTGSPTYFIWHSGCNQSENSFTISDADSSELFSISGMGSISNGDTLYTLAPPVPTGYALKLHGWDYSYDGWDCNGRVEVWQQGDTVATFRVGGGEDSATFYVTPGVQVNFIWQGGCNMGDNALNVTDENDSVLYFVDGMYDINSGDTLLKLFEPAPIGTRFSYPCENGLVLWYEVTSDSTVEVAKGNGQFGIYEQLNGNLHIPEQVVYSSRAYTVTSIQGNCSQGVPGAFSYAAILNNHIDTIFVPNTIRHINDCAFVASSASGGATQDWCPRAVVLGDSVESIGQRSFSEMGMQYFQFGKGLKHINDDAFFYIHNKRIKKIEYHGGLNDWIEQWDSLVNESPMATSDLIGAADLYIYGFLIKDITLFAGIVRSNSFKYYSHKLHSVVLLPAVDSVGNNAFENTRNLVVRRYSNGAPWGAKHWGTEIDYSSNLFFNDEFRTLLFGGSSTVTNINTPASVRTIGEEAFMDYPELLSVTLNDSLDTIQRLAFANCTALDTVVIPTGVSFIGDSAFLGVPCIKYNGAAAGAPWGALQMITDTFTVAVTTLGADGTVTGAGQYLPLSTATLTAVDDSSSRFLRWDDGNTANPRTITVISDTTLTAYFAMVVTDTLNIHDTTYIDMHDTTYVPVHDTTYVDVFVHDTTYIDVHDTTYIDVHDTTYVEVHDTTYIDVHDTTYVDVFVHDTTYIDVHDTTYVDVHDTTYINIHDTTYIYIHDTTFVDVPYPVHDTTYIDVHDTTYIDVLVHDTTVVTDTLWLTQYDTVWLHDTIIVHDTVYITQEGVDGAEAVNAKVYASGGRIVVEDADGNTVTLYDVSGRMLATKRDDGAPLRFDVPASGTYMIKIGDAAARKIVVVK